MQVAALIAPHERRSDVILWVRWIIDHPMKYQDAYDGVGFDIFGSYNGVEGVVKVRSRGGVISIVTAHEKPMVEWWNE